MTDKFSFYEHKETTAKDIEAVAEILTKLAKEIREGNMQAFEKWWFEGGTEEGDAKVFFIRENLLMRYFFRSERIDK